MPINEIDSFESRNQQTFEGRGSLFIRYMKIHHRLQSESWEFTCLFIGSIYPRRSGEDTVWPRSAREHLLQTQNLFVFLLCQASDWKQLSKKKKAFDWKRMPQARKTNACDSRFRHQLTPSRHHRRQNHNEYLLPMKIQTFSKLIIYIIRIIGWIK